MLFLVILILSFFSSYLLPWWAVAIAAFLGAFFLGKSPGKSFLTGFAAVFVVWTVLALVKSIPNHHMLAGRVAQLFPIPHKWYVLMILTAFIGGLVGAMGALSGVLTKRALGK
jgi:hypothetical protein